MFPSSSPHLLFHHLESYPFITPLLYPPILYATMLYPTQGKDLRADNAVLSPGLVNYNRELGLICWCGAAAHPIPLSQAFSSFSPCPTPTTFLSQSGSLSSRHVQNDKVCIHTIDYRDKLHLCSVLYTYATLAEKFFFF